ncbi:hypothetical protein Sjap_001233 [Stephania japonica]|uniref:Uncharacterized protein n=1 Tax=Stephania japonica TaxID=461633 RepID=A0AAP0KL38_9MAGN
MFWRIGFAASCRFWGPNRPFASIRFTSTSFMGSWADLWVPGFEGLVAKFSLFFIFRALFSLLICWFLATTRRSRGRQLNFSSTACGQYALQLNYP